MATGNLVTRATLDSKEFDSALDRMKGNIKSFSKSGKEASDELGSAFSDILGEFAPSIGKDIQSVIDKVQTAANIIKKAFNFSDLNLGANITQQMQNVTNVTNNASSNITGALTTSGLAGIEVFKKLGGKAADVFKSIISESMSLLALYSGGFKSAIQVAIAQFDYLLEGFKAIINVIKREWGAVDKIMKIDDSGVYEEVPKKFADKFKSAFRSIDAIFKTYFDSNILGNLKNFATQAGTIFQGIVKHPKMMLGIVGNLFKSGLTNILSLVGSFSIGVIQAFASITVAIISNPIAAAIAAIVAALALATASLGAFFTRTEEGSNQWTLMKAKATGYFNGVMDAFANIGKSIMNGETIYGKFVKKVGGWIIDLIVTPLKWIGTFLNSIIEMLTGVDIAGEAEKSSQIAEEIAAKELEMMEAWEGKVDLLSKSNRLLASELKTKAEKLRDEAEDIENLSDKLELLQQAKDLEDEANDLTLEHLRNEVLIATERYEANLSNLEARQAYNDLCEELKEKEASFAKESKAAQRNINSILKQSKKEAAELTEKLKEVNKYMEMASKMGVKIDITVDNVKEVGKQLVESLLLQSLSEDLFNDLRNAKPEPIEVPIKPVFERGENGEIEEIGEELGPSIDEALGLAAGTIKANAEVEDAAKEKAEEIALSLNEGITDAIAQGIGSLMESLGDALVSGDWSSGLVSMLDSIGSALKSFGSTLISYAIAVDAFKKCFANTAAAMAAGAALIIAGAALSAASSKLLKFETGGIVGGTSYYGDNVLARVNSGEMILNQGQQRNLFDAINSGNFGGGSLTVEFKVSGSNLYGVLNNYNTRRSKL